MSFSAEFMLAEEEGPVNLKREFKAARIKGRKGIVSEQKKGPTRGRRSADVGGDYDKENKPVVTRMRAYL